MKKKLLKVLYYISVLILSAVYFIASNLFLYEPHRLILSQEEALQYEHIDKINDITAVIVLGISIAATFLVMHFFTKKGYVLASDERLSAIMPLVASAITAIPVFLGILFSGSSLKMFVALFLSVCFAAITIVTLFADRKYEV